MKRCCDICEILGIRNDVNLVKVTTAPALTKIINVVLFLLKLTKHFKLSLLRRKNAL